VNVRRLIEKIFYNPACAQWQWPSWSQHERPSDPASSQGMFRIWKENILHRLAALWMVPTVLPSLAGFMCSSCCCQLWGKPNFWATAWKVHPEDHEHPCIGLAFRARGISECCMTLIFFPFSKLCCGVSQTRRPHGLLVFLCLLPWLAGATAHQKQKVMSLFQIL